MVRIVEVQVTMEDIRGQKLRSWNTPHPKSFKLLWVTIQQGLKGQGYPKQKAVERRGEAVVFKSLLTGRQHMPKFPSMSVCLLNLKYFYSL